jgi:hypothetical protein
MNNMMLKTILLFGIMTAFSSCNGQSSYNPETSAISSEIVTGDTVKALGDSLWYIYQDKKNNFWFGSNGEGVF